MTSQKKKKGCKLPVTGFVFGFLVFLLSLSNPLAEPRLPVISRFEQVVEGAVLLKCHSCFAWRSSECFPSRQQAAPAGCPECGNQHPARDFVALGKPLKAGPSRGTVSSTRKCYWTFCSPGQLLLWGLVVAVLARDADVPVSPPLGSHPSSFLPLCWVSLLPLLSVTSAGHGEVLSHFRAICQQWGNQ